jgi:UDP-N-acetylmuramate--alanine ligase
MRVHFIGIGGISMSALAAFTAQNGATVTGSDLVLNPQIIHLAKAYGIKVFIGHKANNITADIDEVITTGAIDEYNPEVVRAWELGIKITPREQYLAQIAGNYKTQIAVAGTHGKSTTTAMLHAILTAANLNPTTHNGAVMNQVNSNYYVGNSDIFLTEACEFRRSLLTLNPSTALITNIDADHMDCYADLNDVKQTFHQFANQSKTAITNADCPNSHDIGGITFAINSPADIKGTDIIEHIRGKFSFTIRTEGIRTSEIKLHVPGKHNVYNALAAASVALNMGIAPKHIVSGLSSFTGIERRFQPLARVEQCDIILDYAHHPTELKTTIQTAKQLYANPLIIFQPHTYTRTLAFFTEFISVLNTCDCALYKTYAAREKVKTGGTALDLYTATDSAIAHMDSAKTLTSFIKSAAQQYDAIILTGAGDMHIGLRL